MNNLLQKYTLLRVKQFVKTTKNPNPIIPVSEATWWRWVREGKAPKPVKLGPKTTVWKASDLQAFIDGGLVLQGTVITNKKIPHHKVHILSSEQKKG